MEKGFIYGLRCPLSGEIRYIGQTIKTLSYRFSRHISKTKSKINKNEKLTHNENWLKKLIELNIDHLITIEEIENVYIEDLDNREIFWISKFKETNNLTNLTEGGNQPKGYHWFHSEESKKKISEGIKKSKIFLSSFTKERSDKIAKTKKENGYVVSTETCKKISEKLKGKMCGDKNPFYGKKHSNETKKLISEKNKGLMTGEKNPFFGKTHNEETKNKIANTLKEKPKKLYYIYNDENILITKGTSVELLDFFNIKRTENISRYCNKDKKYKDYYIKSVIIF